LGIAVVTGQGRTIPRSANKSSVVALEMRITIIYKVRANVFSATFYILYTYFRLFARAENIKFVVFLSFPIKLPMYKCMYMYFIITLYRWLMAGVRTTYRGCSNDQRRLQQLATQNYTQMQIG